MSTPLADHFAISDICELLCDMFDYLLFAEGVRLSTLRGMAYYSRDLFPYPFTKHTKWKDNMCFHLAHCDSILVGKASTNTQHF